MSDLVLMAAITATPPTMVAFATLIQGIRNGRKSEVILAKADEIHTLTNSNLTAVKADLALANQRIQDLEGLVQTLLHKEAP